MDLAFGAGLIKAAVVGPQALFGTHMQAATSLAASIETLGAGRQFLKMQEAQHLESMNRPAFGLQRQQAQFAAEANHHQRAQAPLAHQLPAVVQQAAQHQKPALPLNHNLGRRLNVLG